MENISGLLIAAALAGLIGLEREMRLQNGGTTGFGGFRTFSLIGALGFIATMLGGNFLPLAFLAVFGLIAISHTYEAFKNNAPGLTSELASMGGFLIGVLVAKGEIVFAIATTITFTLLLAFKDYLHNLAKTFTKEEFLAILKFLILTGVILPLLPNETIDPWNIFNPRVVWLMVVLVAGIRFMGFFLAKVLGSKKSIVFTGALGGLASSTAVTSALSAQNKRTPRIVAPFLIGILFANAIMYIRVFIEAEIIYWELARELAIPLFAMALTAGLIGFLMLFIKPKRVKQEEEAITSQPFSLSEALKFGVFFMIILTAARFIPEYFGNTGLYLTGIISGLADTDAITLSMADLAKKGAIGFEAATTVITLAVMTNTVVKILIISVFGGARLKIAAFFALLAVIAAGGASLLFL